MNRILQAILVVVVIGYFTTVGHADAQNQRQSQEVPQQTFIPPLQESDDDQSLTFEELEIGNVSLSGKFAWAGVWVPFQSNWTFDEQIAIDLGYIASPILIDDAAIAVRANGTEVASLRPIIDGEEHRFTFEIPTVVLSDRDGGVYLEFTGFLPLTREECEAPNNAGQWVSILDSTELLLDPDLSEVPPMLEDLPEAITIRNAYNAPPPVIFVLPNDPDSLALTTAARVAVGLGSGVEEGHLPFIVETANSLTDSQRESANLVVIGLSSDNSLLGELSEAFSSEPANGEPINLLTENEEIEDDFGVLQIVNSPWNPVNNVLIVSGGGPVGLDKAGQIIADAERLAEMNSSEFVVRSVSRLPQASARPWQNNITSFRQLEYDDVRVEGTGIADTFFFFNRPSGWVFTDNSTVTLHMAANPSRTVVDANETQSYVDVFANDVYIGTVNFQEEERENEVWVTFDLPARVLNEVPETGERPQVIALRMSVSHTDRLFCNQISVERYWTTIYADSYFTVEHTEDDNLPNLQLFPYPFLGTDDGTVGIVLKPQPTNEEIGLGLSVAATLGHLAFDNFNVSMTAADEASVTDLQNANLILIGQRDEHPLLEEFVASEAAEFGVDDFSAGPNTGFLHEIVSPWNDERVALAVYANTTEGLLNAGEALFLEAPPVGPPGSIALVEGEHETRVFYRSPDLERDPDSIPAPTQAPAQTEEPTAEPTDPTVAELPEETEAPETVATPVAETESPSPNILQIIRENGGTPLALLLGGLAVVALALLVLRGRGRSRRIDTDTPPVFIDAEEPPDQTPPFNMSDEDQL